MPDFHAIEWAQFSVNCPRCGSLERPTLMRVKQNPTMTCNTCGTTIDLNTSEAKERQSEAAKAAMKRAFEDADR
jgi:uncharacterized Zn finger protein